MQATKSKKDNKKITFKTKLTLSTLAAAAVTGGTMAVTGNAHADTINNQANTQTQTQNPQASDLKTQQDASRQAYADANKANADAHQATQNAQDNLVNATAKSTEEQGAVDNAQNDVNQASNDVTTATNKANQAQTDVENAQDAQTQAQNDYDNAVKQSTTSADEQAALDQAQADAKTAEGAVTDAQNKLADATSKQSQAQSNADTATQNVKDATDRVNSDQSAVSQAESNVKNAENDVQTVQNHDQVVAQDQSDVQAKNDTKNKADAKVNDAQKVNDEKIEAQSNAQTAVNDAQKTVDQLSKDTSAEPVENALATSQEWINTLKEAQNYLLTHNNTLSPELDQKLSELGSKLKYQKQYQSDPTLKNQKVEYNNDGLLSNQDEIQITKFALSLINPIREQLGMPALTITQNALKIANNVANTYNRDNWIAYTYNVDSQGNETPIMKGHDVNAFENAINASNPANTGASSEAMTAGEEQDVYDKNGKRTGVTHYIAPTMDDLYARIYGGVADMLFTDSNMQWGHTYTLLGMGRKNENQTNNIGVQTDRYGQIHYVLESSSQNDHSNLINVNNNDASQAYQDLLNAEDNYKKFINDHQNDDLNFSDMVSEQDYKDDKASYDADPNGAWAPTYKATVDQYNKQQAALKPYLDAIDQAQNKLDQVYFTKTSDSSQTDDHAAQLASAKQALQDAQAKLKTATTEASQASADLASAKAEAQHAADELKTAQDKLAHDSGSSMALADAQDKLKNAKAVIAQKQANLADAKKNLQNANTMKSQSDSALEKANADVKDAQDAVQTAQAKAKDANAKVDAIKAKIAADNNSKALSDAEAKLNQTKQDLQVAQSKKDEADKALAKAQDTLKNKQDALKKAQANAQTAAQNLKSAQDAVKKAQAHEQDTQAALKLAKDNLITDSKVYGDSVAIKDQTIHAGEINKIVNPEIANPMAKDPTQSLVMGAFLQMAASKLDTIPTGTTAKWNQPQNVSRDANLVGDHSEDVLVTFPDGSTTTVKMNLHVLVAVTPSQPDKPVVNPGHDQTTTPTDPTDQPGHNVKPVDGNKPSTEPSTTPSHEEQQPGTHTDTPTAKPSEQQPSTQPSGNQGQTMADHKATSNSDSNVTVAPSADHEANGAQTVVTNGDNNVTAKPSDQQPSTQPSGDQGQTKADHKATLNNDRDATVAQSAAHEANGEQTVVTNGDNNVTAKPSDQQPSTQPSGDQGQTMTDHKATSNSDSNVTVAPNADHEANGAQTVVTNGDDNVTAKPSDQQPSTQPSGNQGQSQTATPDHKATVNDNNNVTVAPNADHEADGVQTVVTNGDNNVTVTPVASEVENTNTAKRSDLNNGKLPQTGNAKSSIALGIATLIGMFGLAYDRRKD